MYCNLIKEAVHDGARQKMACELVGISARTYQRWHQHGTLLEDQRLYHDTPAHNRLSDEVRHEVLQVVNRAEYSTLTPHQIVPLLLDDGRYIASESSFYRIMKQNGQLKHRGRSAPVKHKKPKALSANKPNCVYSWDITYLLSPIKGEYYYLYMVMDIYSRKIVGWQVYDCESSSHAADLVEDIVIREKIDKNQLVLHSDNGSPMKGATLRAKMIDLAIVPSYSRPRVSNDNPYSESLFKTVKYHYSYPQKPFANLKEAREWVSTFVLWYNDEHQHSAIKYVTPNQCHSGLDKHILQNRKKVIEQAKLNYPERWNGRNTRNLVPIDVVYLNPNKSGKQTEDKGLQETARMEQAA
jgi:putative transposase